MEAGIAINNKIHRRYYKSGGINPFAMTSSLRARVCVRACVCMCACRCANTHADHFHSSTVRERGHLHKYLNEDMHCSMLSFHSQMLSLQHWFPKVLKNTEIDTHNNVNSFTFRAYKAVLHHNLNSPKALLVK